MDIRKSGKEEIQDFVSNKKQVWYLRDTREHENEGWVWEPRKLKGHPECLGTEVVCLKQGDYSIKGFENIVVIERKASFQELYGNLINKEGRERFEAELERLRDVKYKYLVVESNISKDMMGMSLPQFRGYGPPISKIVEMLFNYQLEFGIIPIFAGDCGKKIVTKIFNNVINYDK